MRYPREHKSATRRHVVETASRAFRRSGIEPVGIAAVMAEAGLTAGGFYGHFASKEALVGEAMADALAAAVERLRGIAALAEAEGRDPLVALIDRYLGRDHYDHPEHGCPIATLGAELARASATTRGQTLAGMETVVAVYEERLPMAAGAARHARALALFGLLVGCLQIARLADDEDAAATIRAAGHEAALALIRAPIA